MQAEEREGWDRLVAASREECVHRSRGERCYLELTDIGTAVILAAADEIERLKAIAEAARAYREAKAKYVTVFDAPAGEWKQRYVEFEAQYRAAEVALWAALDGEGVLTAKKVKKCVVEWGRLPAELKNDWRGNACSDQSRRCTIAVRDYSGTYHRCGQAAQRDGSGHCRQHAMQLRALDGEPRKS